MTHALQNNKYLSETLALREELEGGFIILAERLKKIRDERLWENSEYDSFGEFLQEMRISEPTASKLIGVYEKFVLMGGISPQEVAKVGWTNISIFLPSVKTKEDAKNIWEKTHLLDRTDAMRTWQEMKSGKDMAKCLHKDTYAIKICRGCGYKWQIHEEEKR